MTTSIPSQSRWPLATVALLAGLLIGGVAVWAIQERSEEDQVATTEETEITFVEAEARDLSSFEEWAGVLEPGPSAEVTASVRGTITQTTEPGELVEFGQIVANIDGNPVVALYGAVPQFRALDSNSDSGADVQQLEANLVALGYDPNNTVAVDGIFNDATGLMVERWETDLGLTTPDQIVESGQVVFISGPSEVVSRTPVGSQVSPGQSLLSTLTLAESGFIVVTEDELDTTDEIPLDAVSTMIDTGVSEDALLAVGRPIGLWEAALNAIALEVDVDVIDTFPLDREVDVELPDGQIIAARVDEVSEVARTQQNGNANVTVVDVSIAPLDEIESSFTAGPVTIRVEDETIVGATVVPVRSLVALSDGGHAVEIEGRGLVGVELGSFDEGWVELVDGAVSPGDSIAVPS